MGKIKAGVVVVTKFCAPKSRKFASYIEYIDREEATRGKKIQTYNLYHDYMGNPEKTEGIFTREKDCLDTEELKRLKRLFQTAQDNGSLMWQTVISFDNRWLEEQGVLKKEEVEEKLDSVKIKEVSRNAIEKMLKKEGLEGAIWSGAIHYNTDNIHIHIATVEENPTRQKKKYIVYEEQEVNGRLQKVPTLDCYGKVVEREEHKGRFQLKSIEACKGAIVQQLIEERGYNKRINELLRESFVKGAREEGFLSQEIWKERFLDLYEQMPLKENRSLWNYNNSIMASRKENIDAFVRNYLEEFKREEFQEWKGLVYKQEEAYQKAYGGVEHRYLEGKRDDLYSRMGNAVLRQLRAYDKEVRNGAKVGTNHSERRDMNSVSRFSGFYSILKAEHELEYILRKLYHSMGNEYETWKNIQEYEKDLEKNSEKQWIK